MKLPTLEKNRLIDILPYQLENYPIPNALNDKVTGTWRTYSTEEAINIIDKVSLGLIKSGIQKSDKIAVISINRVEWTFIDMGILQTGAIVVPLYPNTSEDNYRFIFDDAQVKIVFVEDEELYHKVQRVNRRVKTNFDAVYTFDKVENALNWETVTDMADESFRQELNNRKDDITQNDIATIIYTSGTTGVPKGVMLTHKNIMGNVNSLVKVMPIEQFKKSISFLPLCHIFEKTLVYIYMTIGTAIHYPQSIETIGDNIKEIKPNYFITVPRLLEKIFERIMDAGYKLSPPKKAIFGWAVNLGNHFDNRGRNNWFYNFRLFFARKLVFKKWVEALGGEIKGIVSGAAALQPRLARIFTAAGIPIVEGYGLTETSPVLNCNRFEKDGFYFGTVGMAIPDVSIKIGENNEILAKGPNVMIGYYNNPEATKAAFDEDGWFKTGDTGEMLDGKFLKITGRLKEEFKTSGGKFIVPQLIENKMKESFFIEHFLVIGENRNYPAAIAQPYYEFIRKWAKQKNIEVVTKEEIAHSHVVKERIWEEVQKYNKRFGKTQQIKKIAIISDLWSIETGELTPTLKIKRDVVCEKYKDLIEKLYNSPHDVNVVTDENNQ